MSRSPVLFLGRTDSPVLAHLREVAGDELLSLEASERLTPEMVARWSPRWVVSHGYRIILRRDVLGLLPDRVINLHISLLPWNRGADPVLWSVLENTPTGVTIHFMDEGVDTGDVIAQRPVEIYEDDTFAALYTRCTRALADLFREQWSDIDRGRADRRRQAGNGTSHTVRDRAAVEHLLTLGWNTPCAPLRGVLSPAVAPDPT